MTVEKAAEAVRDAGNVVVFTGAGLSTASGIPDFRSDGGIWDAYDPYDFHINSFESQPDEFWANWVELSDDFIGDVEPEPNAAHDAVAGMYSDGYVDAVVTQNVDGLHQEAGVPDEDVVEIHGNLRNTRCESCYSRRDVDDALELARDGELPPRCDCGGVLKPGGVLFGESLPKDELYRSQSLAETADVFVVAGSSLTVEPAASFPRTAASKGAKLVIVNLDETPLSERADFDFRGDVTELLPEIRDHV